MTLEKAKKEIIKVHEAIIEGRKSGDLTRANKIYESTRKKLKNGSFESELGFFLNHTANYNLNTEERYVKFKEYVEELTKKKGQTPHSVSSKTPVLINNDPSIVNKIKKYLAKYSLKDTVNLILETEKVNKKKVYDLCLKLKNEKNYTDYTNYINFTFIMH